MQVDIELLCIRAIVLVAFVVEMLCCLAMSLPHKVVFTLASKAEGLGRTGVVAVPCLCGTDQISTVSLGTRRKGPQTFGGTCCAGHRV